MIIAGRYEVPDVCPKACSYRDQAAHLAQGGMCFRCPIMNCAGEDALLRPEDYRKDWAAEWARFFAALEG